MYGMNDMKNKNEHNDDEHSHLSGKSPKHSWDRNDTCRNNLKHLLHSHRFHLIIVGLVVLDCIIVVIELMIDLEIFRSESNECNAQIDNHTKTSDNSTGHSTGHSSHSTATTIAHVLHYLSISILCIFTTEIVLKVYALRIEFFKNGWEVFDAIIIVTSLTLDIVFINHNDILRFIGLVIVLRLWRIIRVIHGIVISVKTPLEHSFEKEKKLREKFEGELAEMHLYTNSLEIEITTLRALIKKNGIVNGVPQTYLKIDRKV